MGKKTAVIMGAGPAGLSAAYELLSRTDYIPILIEQSDQVGGLSKTVNSNGNRIDIGGHRFFTKSDRVEKWWFQFLSKDVMLLRSRLSRILFLGKLFAYPISLSVETLSNLGLRRCIRIMASYARAHLNPPKKINTLEDFFISRFGRELYRLFFESYTEKVWGVPCKEIKPEWGAQRVKGLSILKAVFDAVTKTIGIKSLLGKKVETSLIEAFHYPKFGPGQLWDQVASEIVKRGGKILLSSTVDTIQMNEDHSIRSVSVSKNGAKEEITADLFLSTLAIKDLVGGMVGSVPKKVRAVASRLCYRDFITVGILAKNSEEIKKKLSLFTLKDNWIYVQEPHVKVGRIQIFNNWSPFMVSSPDHLWFGLEYFCQEGDVFWKQSDQAIAEFAKSEVSVLGLVDLKEMTETKVVRAPKAYPAYFGGYEQFETVKDYLVQIPNLYLIGRNGLHRYNNSDHSVLTALTAVDQIVANKKDQASIWMINTEQEYHEAKT